MFMLYVMKKERRLFGLQSSNNYNSDILLELVDKLHFDIVHVQYEPGLYGLKLAV